MSCPFIVQHDQSNERSWTGRFAYSASRELYRDRLYSVRHLTFFFQLVLISWMVTLDSYLIWQIISFILPPKEYVCVYAWTMLGSRPAIDLQKMPILAKKNHLFRWTPFWSWRVCKQAKLLHLGHRKPAHIHLKAKTPKTSHFLVRI